MSDEQFDLLICAIAALTAQVGRVATALETGQGEPNYQQDLRHFKSFDWSSINARVIHKDSDGAAIVEWRGKNYVRRSPDNKYEPTIFFSRANGKNEDGSNRYERLITFKTAKTGVEPVSGKVQRLVAN